MAFSVKAPPSSSLFFGDSSVPYAHSPIPRFSILRFPPAENGGGSIVCASKKTGSESLSSIVFEPFEEVKDLSLVPAEPQVSLARQKFSEESEAAINDQINVEYNVSYVYHAMYAYFDRDNVALKGLAKCLSPSSGSLNFSFHWFHLLLLTAVLCEFRFFKESSVEEREHAEALMEYQNQRGGKVKLQRILMPLSEFDHEEKGDALHAMELALSLEKLTNEKLLNLHKVAERNHDVQMADFIESRFLTEQVESIKKISEYVAQLRRVGKGHGVWHFDQMLLQGGVGAGAGAGAAGGGGV
ncbi:hypothetical protein SAY87_001173 [Trapa incisa]|uniref:Ferritin n=1 Tax=Trapa incisa TaxID=236973 RepID=A0AAN7GUW8_9MYRT|nr:hypothetical protein SAY87_001173 [Trapa incisa]